MKAYVYAVIVDGVIRYVGKGRGNRLNVHMKKVRSIARRRAAGETVWATHFYNKLTKAWLDGAEITVNLLVVSLSDQEAFDTETKMIAAAPAGSLWNTAPGGQGFSAEQWADPMFREKMAEREKSKRTPEYHAKRSAIAQANWDDPEWRARWMARRHPNGRQGAISEKRLIQADQLKQKYHPYNSWNEYQKAKALERIELRQRERDERAKAGLRRSDGKPINLSTRFTSERATLVQLNEWRDPERRAARLKTLGRKSDGRWRGKAEVVS